MKRVRMYASIALLAAAISGVLLIPLPSRVNCYVEIHPRDATTVYVVVPGRLEELKVEPGDVVEEGDLLVKLRNIDHEILVAEQEGQARWYKVRLDSIRAMGRRDEETASSIAETTKAWQTAATELAQLELEGERLTIEAPVAGTVLAPPSVPSRPDASGRLPVWSGSPLDKDNLGAVLLESTKLCEIGDPKKLEARMVIDQNDIALVDEGQPVQIMLDQSADFVYHSKVEKKSSENLGETPIRLSGQRGGPIPSQTDQTGTDRPLKPYYEAVAPLPEHELLRVGLIGKARIETAPRTLGQRLWRYVTRTFNFDL